MIVALAVELAERRSASATSMFVNFAAECFGGQSPENPAGAAYHVHCVLARVAAFSGRPAPLSVAALRCGFGRVGGQTALRSISISLSAPYRRTQCASQSPC